MPRSANPRIVPVSVTYSAVNLPPETEAALNRIATFQFSPRDFSLMAEGLALCEATWRQRKFALKKRDVIDHLQKTIGMVDQLRDLLKTDATAIETDVSRARAFVASRLRYPAEALSALDHFGDAALAELRLLHGTRRELRQGSDGMHLDDLLDHVRRVLQENGLSTTYTTDKRVERRALAAEMAAEIAKLLPREIREHPPQATESVFLNRLVETRKQERKKGAPSYFYDEYYDPISEIEPPERLSPRQVSP